GPGPAQYRADDGARVRAARAGQRGEAADRREARGRADHLRGSVGRRRGRRAGRDQRHRDPRGAGTRRDPTVVPPAGRVRQRQGLADPLADLMLEQACQWKRRWDLEGLRLNVSVNISPTSLGDPTAADRYQRIVQAQNVDPAEVVLELTESSVMADAARALSV